MFGIGVLDDVSAMMRAWIAQQHGYEICYVARRRAGNESGSAPGFQNLTCGCVVGRYRDLASGRELTYVEEKGSTCDTHAPSPQSHGRQSGRAHVSPA